MEASSEKLSSIARVVACMEVERETITTVKKTGSLIRLHLILRGSILIAQKKRC